MFLLSLKKELDYILNKWNLMFCFFVSCKTATIWKQVFLSLSSSALFDLFIQKLKIDPKNHKKRLTGLKSEVVITWSRPQSEARTDAGSFSRQLLLTLDDWARFGYGLSLNRAANTAQPVPNFLSLFHQKHVRKSWSIRSSSSAFKYGAKCAHLLSAR